MIQSMTGYGRCVKVVAIFVVVCLAPMLLLGCTNADYDLDKVDYTLGIGGDGITLPGNNSTKEITLDDLLDISESDLITTDANGDYKLFKEPEDATDPVEVVVDPITLLSDNSHGLSYSVDLPSIPDYLKGQTISLPYRVNIAGQAFNIDIPEISDRISILDYEFDADKDIRSLEYVELGENGQGVTLTVDITLPEIIRKFSKLQVDLPDMLTMTCPSMPNQFNTQNNVLILDNYTNTDNHLQVVFNVTRINVKTTDNDNYVKLEDGRFKLKANVGLTVKFAEIIIPTTSSITFDGTASFNAITITSARGIVDPVINFDDVGTIQINRLPDFLSEEQVVADIDNPQIWLTLSSTLPLGGTVNAQLTSDTHSTPVVLDPIYVKGSSDGVNPVETRIVICQHEPSDLKGFTPMMVDNLSNLIEKLQEGMQIRFSVNSVRAAQETALIKFGYPYILIPTYKFECPLAFGNKAVIIYSYTDTDWHKEIERLNLAKDAYIQVTGNAVNKIPANLELEIIPLGIDGQELSPSIINVDHIKKDIAGTKGEPTTSPLEVKISGDISYLDGIRLRLNARGSEELRGITLNNSSQTLQLKDMTVRLVGKVIYDANKK